MLREDPGDKVHSLVYEPQQAALKAVFDEQAGMALVSECLQIQVSKAKYLTLLAVLKTHPFATEHYLRCYSNITQPSGLRRRSARDSFTLKIMNFTKGINNLITRVYLLL